jgi:hypothetical protein
VWEPHLVDLRPKVMRERVVALCLAVVFVGLVGACDGGAESPAPAEDVPKNVEVAVPLGSRTGSGSSVGVIIPAACVAGVQFDGTFYVIASGGLDGVPARDLEASGALQGVVVPGCNDTGGVTEPDTPIQGWAIEGVAPDEAILVSYP